MNVRLVLCACLLVVVESLAGQTVAKVLTSSGSSPLVVSTTTTAPSCSNLSSVFPDPLTGLECWGLLPNATGPMGNPITDEAGCAALCCGDPTCHLYNWNTSTVNVAAMDMNKDIDGLDKHVTASSIGCWTGNQNLSAYTCRSVDGWTGRGGRNEPPLPPPPAPCPASPSGTVGLCMRSQPPTSPLPFQMNSTLTLDTLGADSLSLLRKPQQALPLSSVLSSSSSSSSSSDLDRWYPVSGEIHLGRVPESEWREQLMRMRGGGLDMIAVYVFWFVAFVQKY